MRRFGVSENRGDRPEAAGISRDLRRRESTRSSRFRKRPTIEFLEARLTPSTAAFALETAANLITNAASASATATSRSDNQTYVNQLYLTLDGRSASDSELSHWSNLLDKGVSRQFVVAIIARSPEAVSLAVSNIFQTLLGTTPTQAQVHNALNMPNASAMNITAAILGSRTFFKDQGGGTIDGFLSALSNSVLGSDLPTETQNYFTHELRQGVSTQTIAAQLLSSKMGLESTVNSLYEQYLGRAADSTELTQDVHLIEGGIKPGQVAVQLLASTEYYDQAIAAITPGLFLTPTVKTSTKTS